MKIGKYNNKQQEEKFIVQKPSLYNLRPLSPGSSFKVMPLKSRNFKIQKLSKKQNPKSQQIIYNDYFLKSKSSNDQKLLQSQRNQHQLFNHLEHRQLNKQISQQLQIVQPNQQNRMQINQFQRINTRPVQLNFNDFLSEQNLFKDKENNKKILQYILSFLDIFSLLKIKQVNRFARYMTKIFFENNSFAPKIIEEQSKSILDKEENNEQNYQLQWHTWRKQKIQNIVQLQQELIDGFELLSPHMLLILKWGLNVNRFRANYPEEIKTIIQREGILKCFDYAFNFTSLPPCNLKQAIIKAPFNNYLSEKVNIFLSLIVDCIKYRQKYENRMKEYKQKMKSFYYKMHYQILEKIKPNVIQKIRYVANPNIALLFYMISKNQLQVITSFLRTKDIRNLRLVSKKVNYLTNQVLSSILQQLTQKRNQVAISQGINPHLIYDIELYAHFFLFQKQRVYYYPRQFQDQTPPSTILKNLAQTYLKLLSDEQFKFDQSKQQLLDERIKQFNQKQLQRLQQFFQQFKQSYFLHDMKTNDYQDNIRKYYFLYYYFQGILRVYSKNIQVEADIINNLKKYFQNIYKLSRQISKLELLLNKNAQQLLIFKKENKFQLKIHLNKPN